METSSTNAASSDIMRTASDRNISATQKTALITMSETAFHPGSAA